MLLAERVLLLLSASTSLILLHLLLPSTAPLFFHVFCCESVHPSGRKRRRCVRRWVAVRVRELCRGRLSCSDVHPVLGAARIIVAISMNSSAGCDGHSGRKRGAHLLAQHDTLPRTVVLGAHPVDELRVGDTPGHSE